MSTLVTVKGIITNQKVWVPKENQKGNPVLKIDLLQITDQGTSVITVKDDDLNAEYENGQEVEFECMVSYWKFDKMGGISFKVYKGKVSKLSLKLDSLKKAS